MLDHLKGQGLLENTLIIITSDHGEEFKEHTAIGHGKSLYRQSVQVPLLIIYPNQIPANLRIKTPVSLRNIPATILDLIGRSESSPFPGGSLATYLDNSEQVTSEELDPILTELTDAGISPSFYPISRGDMRSIVVGDIRVIFNGDGVIELYDFNLDPQELNDLAGTPEVQAALPEYRRLLEKLLTQTSAQ